MQILYLEAFFGGSHRAFAEGLQRHSRHQIKLITLPDRFWKWRMRGAALQMIPRIPPLAEVDLIMTTNMLSLADLRALLPAGHPPLLVYFHENQLTYPVARGDQRDLHFGFTDMTTALAAGQVWFNSHSHLNAFLEALPSFLRQMPDARPTWVTEAIRRKTSVLYPGCELPLQPATTAAEDAPPLIIWNHRWEFDKDPKTFFAILYELMARGTPFRVAVLGECFQDQPKCFLEARERLGDRIVHFGYAATTEAYHRWLARGHVVVSTALQENFGFAIVEAVRHGCLPLVPHRLSYPEIIPQAFHDLCLYATPAACARKLADMLRRRDAYQAERVNLQQAMGRYAWRERIGEFDERLAAAARGQTHGAYRR